MIKKVFLLRLFSALFLLFIYNCLFCQLRIDSAGRVSIIANTQDWESAIRTTVPTYNSCAYHLRYANADRFFVHSAGYLWCQRGGYFGSDISLKENIVPIHDALKTVKDLKGVQFTYKPIAGEVVDTTAPQSPRYGFIAQEVEQILPGIIKDMPDGTKSMSYTDIIAFLVEAVKEQQLIIDEIRREIRRLELSIEDNENRIDGRYIDTTTGKETFIMDEHFSKVQLYQNIPNPFTNNTKIQCFIPEMCKNAELCVFNNLGHKVQCFKISNRNSVEIEINAGSLPAGIYTYILIVDGKATSTKQMILTQ